MKIFHLFILIFMANFTNKVSGSKLESLGTLNSITNGFGTVSECAADPSRNDCGNYENTSPLVELLNFTTTNQCIASNEQIMSSGIEIPDCPNPEDNFSLLDHSFPSAAIFAMFMGSNSAFLHELATEYLADNRSGRFNLVVPRSYSRDLARDKSLLEVLNNPRVNIIYTETMPHSERWMQDTFEFGSLNGKPALYQLEHAEEKDKAMESRLACKIAKACDVPYLIPPDMVDPNYAEYNGLNGGGNLEVMPGGSVIRGILKTKFTENFNLPEGAQIPFQTSAQAIQKQALETTGNRVVDLDVSFLRVGHVDEIVNFVQTDRPAPCNFAVMLASPEKAFEIMERSAIAPSIVDNYISDFQYDLKTNSLAIIRTYDSLEPRDKACWVNGDYINLANEGAHNPISQERKDELYGLNCIGKSTVTTFVESDQYKILKRVNTEGENSVSRIMRNNKEIILKELQQTTGCNEFPVVDVPVFFRDGLSFTPDLVNGVVHTNSTNTSSIIMPSTYFKPFEEYVERELNNLGVKASFVHAIDYHVKQGSVHCGTNTARVCK
jgi:hypothetical protein